MVCKKCNKEIKNDLFNCPFCGAATGVGHDTSYEQIVVKDYLAAEDKKNVFLGILSLLFPFLGFGLCIAWKKYFPKRTKDVLIYSVLGAIIWVAVILVLWFTKIQPLLQA